jgi:peptidoglycan LD-endopeptidase LytH
MRALIGVLLIAVVAGLGFYFGRASASRQQAQLQPEQPPQTLTPQREQSTPPQERARTQEPLLHEPARIEPQPANLQATNPTEPFKTPSPEHQSIPADVTIGLPLASLKPSDVQDTFDHSRGAGERRHEATDIMAPKGTPVIAVDNGIIKKLFNSQAGGLTIYQFDTLERYAYYYAHLDGYAPGLKEGMLVKKGDLIGYVGVTGNSDPNGPHLHFAIFQLGPEKRWYEGTALNPYPALMRNFEKGRTPATRR